MFYLIVLLSFFLPQSKATVYTVCSSGCTYSLSQFQTAIDAATCGDIIQITAGQTVTGSGVDPFYLRKKITCNTNKGPHVIIRSSGVSNLGSGVRVTPSDTANLAKITISAGPWAVISNEKGAGYYRFHGIEFTAHSSFVGDLIEFGTRSSFSYVFDNKIEDLAHHIEFEQCYFHGDSASTNGPRRGIRANMASMIVRNSWFENIKNQSGESNAIAGWNAQGPFFFYNNHLESVAITTLFGGAEPNIRGLRANGNFFYGNHYYRSWKYRVRFHGGDPSGTCLYDSSGGEYYKNTDVNTYWRCDSGVWTSITSGEFSPYYWQKNIFELKNAWRTWVEGNFLENAWSPATQNQFGAVFLFNLVDNDPPSGTAEPAATVGYVHIQNNYARRAPWGVTMGGVGGPYWLAHNNINVTNNILDEIGDSPYTLAAPELNGSKWGGGFMSFGGSNINITYDLNTFISKAPVESRAAYLFGALSLGTQTIGASFNGNIVPWNQYGFFNDAGSGNLWGSIPDGLAPGYAFHRSLIVNNTSASIYARPYPIVNTAYDVTSPSNPMPCNASTYEINGSGTQFNGKCGYPAAYSDVGFTNYSSGDYSLSGSSNYLRWGPMGRNPGANTSAVSWSTSGVSNSNATLPVYLNFVIKSIARTSSSLLFRYVSPSTATCTTSVSLKSDMSSPTSTTDSGGDASRTASITGLSANKRYYWQVVCDSSYTRDGIILTSP